MNLGLAIGLIVAAAVVFGVVGFVVGGAHRKKVAEAAIGSATEEAARIVNNAMPMEGVEKLVEFMKKFEAENA